MEWFKQHADTIAIIGTFMACFWTLNSKINEMDKDLAVIKAVLIMKNIMPTELCKKTENAEPPKGT